MALLIPSKVAKQIRKSGTPAEDWKALRERLQRIVGGNPHASQPDVERVGDGFRVRDGDSRALYKINDRGDVEVVKVGHRREVYR